VQDVLETSRERQAAVLAGSRRIVARRRFHEKCQCIGHNVSERRTEPKGHANHDMHEMLHSKMSRESESGEGGLASYKNGSGMRCEVESGDCLGATLGPLDIQRVRQAQGCLKLHSLRQMRIPSHDTASLKTTSRYTPHLCSSGIFDPRP